MVSAERSIWSNPDFEDRYLVRIPILRTGIWFESFEEENVYDLTSNGSRKMWGLWHCLGGYVSRGDMQSQELSGGEKIYLKSFGTHPGYTERQRRHAWGRKR